MHKTALKNASQFFDTYKSSFSKINNVQVVDIGSLDVNGSLKRIVPISYKYLGVDIEKGKGVDIVLEDPYTIPLKTNSVDIVLSSSCFEHSELFWLLFLEILRILKPAGVFYLNVPSNGAIHRYPLDCWRFYPDSGKALITWAERNNFSPVLLEAYTSNQDQDIWNDYVAIFLKDKRHKDVFTKQIVHTKKDLHNGQLYGTKEIINPQSIPEDLRILRTIFSVVINNLRLLKAYLKKFLLKD